MWTMRDAAVALFSAVVSLAVSLSVLAVRASERRAEVDAMEQRLVKRMDSMAAKNDELAAALDRCRIAGGASPGPTGAEAK